LPAHNAHIMAVRCARISHSTATRPEIYPTAMDLALRSRHHLFDTLHTQGALVVTADERDPHKAKREGPIMLLCDFAWD
jgi:hypothetical protein